MGQKALAVIWIRDVGTKTKAVVVEMMTLILDMFRGYTHYYFLKEKLHEKINSS